MNNDKLKELAREFREKALASSPCDLTFEAGFLACAEMMLPKITLLEARIEKLKEALRFIESGCLVPPDGGSPDWMDAIKCAEKALAEDDKAKE